MASLIIFLRKDAQIGGYHKQNAKRAISADNLAELLLGVISLALAALKHSSAQQNSWVA